MGNWAERRNIAYGSYQELAGHAQVQALLRDCIEQVNRDLAKDPQLGGSQIRRFLVLHKELDADDGELTRTRKVRRSTVGERYQVLVDALYSAQEVCHVETRVTFEDGRTGLLAADIKIRDAKIYPIKNLTRDAA